jgi:pimeloyl-ACP methyl ester carboxylesterase
VIPLLAARYDVISVDLPGFGDSPGLPDGMAYDIETSMVNLTRFFKQVGVERPHVVGNSLGGALAIELAARDLVRSATAISPAGFWTRTQRRYAIELLAAHRRAAGMPGSILARIAGSDLLRAQAGRLIFAHPERITPDDFIADAIAMHTCEGFDPTVAIGRSYECLSKPVVPTTVAWGLQDRILPPGQFSIAMQRLARARFVELPGCGHVPMVDDPERIIAAIDVACSAAA